MFSIVEITDSIQEQTVKQTVKHSSTPRGAYNWCRVVYKFQCQISNHC